jgi:hypothetical protein
MSYELVGISSLGNITLSTQGILYFEAIENAFGIDSLIIRVCDSDGLCSESELQIIVNPINDLPVISLQPINLEEDSEITVNLNNYVSDIEGSPLLFALTENALNGSVEISSTGLITYIPNQNFFGEETVSFLVCDNENGCTEGTIEIIVESINDVPQTQNTQITLSEDSAMEGSLSDSASDADGEELFYTILEDTHNGTFIVSADGSFAYAPAANYFGWDTLQFMACDASGACDTSIISFEVTFVNDLPIINSEGVQIIINNSFSGTVADNDIELDFEPLVYTLVDDNSGGSFILQSDGSYTYTPNLDTTGLFTVNYAACDPCSACEYGTLTLLVVSEEDANTPPVASSFTGQTCPGGSIAINLFNSISDEQESSDALNLSFGTANSGNYQLDAETQELIYQASPFASGEIVIPYYVCDNGLIQMCDTAFIIIDILPASTIEITGFLTEHISCFGSANGSINIEAETSIGSLLYNWNNGDETASIDQLSAGVYSVTISSDAPCPINQTAQFEIFEPSPLVATYEITDVNGNTSSIGDAITVVVNGGTPSYNIEWITPTTTVFNETSIEISDNGNYTFTITDANNCMLSETIVISGVTEFAASSLIQVYPNPATGTDKLTISSSDPIESISIVDSKGKLVATAQPNQLVTSIEMGQLANGMYTIRVLTHSGTSHQRIIKQ